MATNSARFLAQCSFDPDQAEQEKFYRDEVAPCLNVWTDFTAAELTRIARNIDQQYAAGFNEDVMIDVRSIVNAATDNGRYV